MTVPKSVREQVRQRANFACEYCQISETDAGGLLTIDHFRPISKGGNDHLNNLIYCCHRCNSYKYNYFPSNEGEKEIWNPRKESREAHFFLLEDGSLQAISPVGKATIQLLRLNRPPLISFRVQKRMKQEETRLLQQYHIKTL